MFISAAQSSSTAFSALIWWTVPILGVLGSVIYVVWVSKFQDKFDNQTNRSVGKFQEFQKTFDPTAQSGITIKPREDEGKNFGVGGATPPSSQS